MKNIKDNIKLTLNNKLVEELSPAKPYMLRNDGKLLECGDVHPYISYTFEEKPINNLYELLFGQYEDLIWFYNNTAKQDTRDLITSFLASAYFYFKNNTVENLPVYLDDQDQAVESILSTINFLGINIFDCKYVKTLGELLKLFEELNICTNQEFCRVRTSDLRYGGYGRDIYFRISSLHFNWFDLIWSVVLEDKRISDVTIVRDTQTFGGSYDPYKINGVKIEHMPREQFLTLSGNPIIEKLEHKSDVSKNNFDNFQQGKTLSESCFYLHPKYAVSVYKANIEEKLDYDINNILQPKAILEKIVKKGNKWQVQSEKGKNLGTYDTKEEAEKRLQQVHYFKHMNEDLNLRHLKSLNSLGEKLAYVIFSYLYDEMNFECLMIRNKVIIEVGDKKYCYYFADDGSINVYNSVNQVKGDSKRFDDIEAVIQAGIDGEDVGPFKWIRSADAILDYIDKAGIKDESLTESLLLEKRRNDLLAKSRAGDNYKTKGREHENRYTRRTKSKIAATVADYNHIDMNAFFKGDILEFGVKVQGETNNYVVLITFDGVLKALQNEVIRNKNKLEFKCVVRAIMQAFNNQDVLVSCSCPDWTYTQQYWATQGRYNSDKPQLSNGKWIANPHDTKGAGCKHINLVLSNLNWAFKLASTIHNYINYCKEFMENNYALYIFPVIYGKNYEDVVQMSVFDYNPDGSIKTELIDDEETLNLANAIGRVRGRFRSDIRVNNMKNFNETEDEMQFENNLAA